jgi:hypothetical protein
MEKWCDPIPLKNYKRSMRAPGLYVIGSSSNGLAPSPSNIDDPYLLSNWPNNFKPEYVGISESQKSGVKSRLSNHARKKGNSNIAKLIEDNTELFFIVIYGNMVVTMLEPLFIALKASGQFECNIRIDYLRSQRKAHEKLHEQMTGKKLEYATWDFDGDGM